MRAHGVANFIDLGGDVIHSRIKADGKISISKVVIDCTRQANGLYAVIAKKLCAPKAPVAADNNDTIKLVSTYHFKRFMKPLGLNELLAPRGAQYRAALMDDLIHILVLELVHPAFHKSTEAVIDTDNGKAPVQALLGNCYNR
jgi:hypothetical protein